MGSLLASFVIPALNEEKNIAATITSIRTASNHASLQHEIILVDHGSKDRTAIIAGELGVHVISHPRGTIAGLRNVGAAHARGDILVFLDADVTLTDRWARHIAPVIAGLARGEKLVTGSHCSPPESNNPLLKYWFSSFADDPRNTHLGTGHMIIASSAFRDIGGFAEDLRTGEDYEFCERAKSKNYQIHNETALKVIHHDFPTNLLAFIRREIWHSRGDLTSLQSMFKSKVVLASGAFLGIHALLLLSAVSGWHEGIFAALFALAGLLFTSSALKYRHSGPKAVTYNAAIFYFYYAGRSLALIKRLTDLLRH